MDGGGTILMAHPVAGAPLLVTTSNGAPYLDAPLVCLARRASSKKKIYDTNGAPQGGCAISSFNTNGASEGGAPLVYTNGALLVWCAISVNPIYSPFSSSVIGISISLDFHHHVNTVIVLVRTKM